MATKSRSSLSWRSSLAQTLRRLQKPDHQPRVAVLGIGNELAGDDAAGVAVARALCAKLCDKPPAVPFRIVDAGTAPENFTGTLRRFGPDLVLLVDAAQMNETPGTIRWLAGESSAGFSASTHTLPLNMLISYLQTEIGCEVRLLGIQPARSAIRPSLPGGDLNLTAPVRKATDEVVSEAWKAFDALGV